MDACASSYPEPVNAESNANGGRPGEHDKAIAAQFGLSHKTIEFHRKKVMEKMQAETTVDLVRSVLMLKTT